MTRKADFNAEEWERVVRGPVLAGLRVIAAHRGGTLRESMSMGRVYAEARRAHGESELLDEIVSSKPELDHTRYRSAEELREHGLQHLRDAVALLAQKATPQELDSYRRFARDLAERVAHAHRERDGSDGVGDAERAALDEIGSALGS